MTTGVFLISIGIMLGSICLLRTRKTNRKIIERIIEEDGVWTEKVPFNPEFHKRRGFFRRSRFLSLDGKKFIPYDNLVSHPDKNFILIEYSLASGRPKGYRIVNTAYTTLKKIPA